MTEEELKIKFDHIQGIFNRCINHAGQVMIDNIASSPYISTKNRQINWNSKNMFVPLMSWCSYIFAILC